ncbi:MAG: carboxylating nicotinate-nucleotide diphosphorylase [Puniceicoccales bacterium]|jgi:nicotinate-nucleotide pyrophosphorylase (carboxylating)|nr:carboxylating nicotinate-nucleotide diphosphorylase [Puniceicoccales bacterium]
MKTQTQSTRLHQRLQWHDLDPCHLQQHIATARDEDLAGHGLRAPSAPPGDPTTHTLSVHCPGTQTARAHLNARQEITLCGSLLLPLILDAYTSPGTCRITRHHADGEQLAAGTTIATIEAPTAPLLTAERTLLNYLQKLTGIATHTATYLRQLDGLPCALLDTRKTTPGWRMLEKYATATAGAWNHRLGLFDRVMFKDNHHAAQRGRHLAALIRHARSTHPGLLIECEVDTLEQIAPVLDTNAVDIILLDNFSAAAMRAALALIGNRAWTEASGGITLANIRAIAELGPDFVSTGALTHQAPWADIGLDWA